MPFAIIGSVLGAVIGGGASLLGAHESASAADKAAQLQYQMFQDVQANEKPFVQAGQNALTGLAAGMTTSPNGTGTGALNKPFNPADLSQTPGYQFSLQQGEQAINSAATASGGVGGANTLKALGGYAEGLASTTYQQQLQDYMAQQQQTFGQEFQVAELGSNAGSNAATNASLLGKYA